MIKMSVSALLLTAVAGFAIAQEPPRGTPLDGIAAVVNEDIVLLSELDSRVATIRDDIQSSGSPMPPASVLRRQVLERLIMERLQLQRADLAGIAVPEDMLNETMSNIARNNGLSLEAFADALASEGYNFTELRDQVRKDMIIQQVQQREVLSRIQVSQRDIDAFLASQEAQSLDSREFDVSHILLRLDANASADEAERVRLLAEGLIVRARAGEDFGELAVTHSQGQQALEGGSLGWRRSTQLPAVFAERVVGMQPGQVADVIRTAGALHVIKLNDIRGEAERVMRQQTRARHILILPGPLVNERRAMERLSEMRRQMVEEGTDFAELARRFSEDPGSALQGGELGWVEPGQTAGPFEDMMNSLPLNEVSEPFATQFGWHIVEVLERRSYDGTDALRMNRARQILRERRAEEQTELWLRRLRDEAYIELRVGT